MATTKASTKNASKPNKPKSGGLRAKILDAGNLSTLVNAYRIGTGTVKTIVVPNASQLASLQDVTVSGTLLKKQLVRLTSPNKRQIDSRPTTALTGLRATAIFTSISASSSFSRTFRANCRMRRHGSQLFKAALEHR